MQKLFATTRAKVIGFLLVVLMLYAWADGLAYCKADPAEQARIRALHGWTITKCPYLPEQSGW
jgi:hypothetical protein